MSQIFLVASLVGLVWRLSYLFLCGWIVRRTGSTAGLRDLAEATRAFRQVGWPIGGGGKGSI